MKTIICGGRDYAFTVEDKMWLNDLAASIPITTVVSGCASGADTQGHLWAVRNHIPVKQFPAEWNKHGRKAGPMRNAVMANYAEVCIAFPGGRGTADMIARATAKGLRVIVRAV
jgi:predicted Rossmann-fold nucleotide-binding protein